MERGRFLLACLALLVLGLWQSGVFSAEKLKFAIGTSGAHYRIPALLAEEQGLWKKRGLDAEVIPFKGGGPLYRAMVAGHIKIAMLTPTSFIPAVAGGVSAIIVSQFISEPYLYLWVRAESHLKTARDIRNLKIGSSRRGSYTFVIAELIIRVLGVEKDVKIVATGGVPESVAALRAGVIDILPTSIFTLIELEDKGVVHRLLSADEYLPKPWIDVINVADKQFVRDRSVTVKEALGGLYEATEFIRANRSLIVKRLESDYGYSEGVAQKVYDVMQYTKGGKINRKGLENVRSFLLEYGLVPEGKAPAIDDLYTAAFTQ